jgi:hypothetical protein
METPFATPPLLPVKIGPRYWSTGAWVVGTVTVFLCLTLAVTTMMLVAYRRWGDAVRFVAAFAFFGAGWCYLVIKARKFYDFFFETDGQTWIRRWDPWSDVMIDLEKAEILDHVSSVEVRGSAGNIRITRNCLRYRQLRASLLGFARQLTTS